MSPVRSVFLVALLATIVGAACSVMLTFEEENRPCGPDENPVDGLGDCIEGYSCMVNVCVENYTVPVGNTCSVNAHCQQGLVCTTSPFICREECEHAFGNSECSANEGCFAMTDADGQPTGACGTSNCDPGGAACGGVETVCVEVKTGVGYCMDSCQVECTGTDCGGNCRFGDNSEPRACQPVGPNDTLACVPEGDRVHGRGCNLLEEFCDENHACVMPPGGEYGVCIRYCNLGETNPCLDPNNPGTPLEDPSTELPASCNEVAGKGFSICGTLPAGPTEEDGGPVGGDGPAGGDPGAPGPKACQEQCINDADCNAGWYCVNDRCVSCRDDDDCIADASFFSGDVANNYCTDDTGCSGVCVTEPTTAANWCASEYSTFVGCYNFGTPVSLQKADTTGPVDVCVNDQWVCRNNMCVWECTTDVECQIRASAWYNTCSVAADCTGTLCIDPGDGTGRCATDAGVAGCFGNQVAADRPLFEGGGNVSVCVDETQTCDSGSSLCVADVTPPDPCDENLDCDPAGTSQVPYPICQDPGPSGVCVCDTTSCQNADGHPNCTADGLCECNDANDCDAALTIYHHTTTWVCE